MGKLKHKHTCSNICRGAERTKGSRFYCGVIATPRELVNDGRHLSLQLFFFEKKCKMAVIVFPFIVVVVVVIIAVVVALVVDVDDVVVIVVVAG